MDDYKQLLPYCKTTRQRELVEALIEHDGDKKVVQEDYCVLETNLNRTLRKLRETRDEKGGSHVEGANTITAEGFSIKKYTVASRKNKDTGEWEDSQKWVGHLRDKEAEVNAIEDAIDSIVARIDGRAKPSKHITPLEENTLMNLFITNDLHFGLFADKSETLDRDYDLDLATEILSAAMDDLVVRAPKAKYAIVADLGDMLEADDFKNRTPKSGHTLDVDGRYGMILEMAIQAMIMLIEKALLTHEKVYFYNIQGNHDETSAIAIRKTIAAWYRNDDKVITCKSDAFQKYHKHGKVMLGFAHGDGLKMQDAGDAMVMHNKQWYADTDYHEYHFGHNHKDKIVEGRLCKAESHRNLPPLNAWAAHAGFGRELGSMKCLTYCEKGGRVGTNEFNVGMLDEK